MPDVLIYADTVRSPELRHEVPIAIPDPFLYVERNGSRHVVIGSLEVPRVQELGGLEVHVPEEYGYDELVRAGKSRDEVRAEMQTRACAALGVRSAVVPATFPLEVADNLRRAGVEVSADRQLFDERRRVKNEAELAGIRRAQAAAEAGMDVARELLRKGERDVGRIKAAMLERVVAGGCTADEFIVSHGAQSAIGHHMGEGTIRDGEPIVIDIWPRDTESACYSDMTRTFVVGDIDDTLREWHALAKEALERAIRETRAGVTGRALFDGTCEIFEAAGYLTQRTKEEGKPLEEGFFHSLGHGVGLEVHEEPSLGMLGRDPLVAGDVITIEPGLYRPGYGGVRLEDIVVVTDDGCENLTEYPYDLEL